jgi:hypothetical protein
MAPVGFVEGAAGDPGLSQVLQTLEKLALAGNPTDDQVRMGQVLAEKKSGRFDGRVAGLDDLLRTGEVVPHEDVDVRRFVVLGEFHENLLQSANRFTHSLLQSRARQRTCKD